MTASTSHSEQTRAKMETSLPAEAIALLEALPTACALLNSQGEFHIQNSAFVREFDEASLCKTYSEFVSYFEVFASSCELLSTIHTTMQLYAPRTGSSYLLRGSPLPGQSPALWLLYVENLTEQQASLQRQRAIHEELLLTSRSMSVGEMATALAHELNQPLGAIINYLNAAKRQLTQLSSVPQRLQEALRLAYSQAAQAAAVITRIREFIRSREPRREACRIEDLATHVLELLQLEAQKSRVKVSLDFPVELPAVWIDRVMIEQVLANLIRNAIDAMATTAPAHRRLHLSAKTDAERRVQVRVRDSGCGIQIEQEQKLFSPFFTTKPNGMGAGLAICRSVIEFHDGSLYFERNPEGGTTFIFTLTPAPPAVSASSSIQPYPAFIR